MGNAKRYKNEKKSDRKILTILFLIFLVLFIYSGIKVIRYLIDAKKNQNLIENMAEFIFIDNENKDNIDKYNVDFESLKQKNSDAIAWIKVNGTNIEYPVVKTTNNDYYLTHNFNKEYNSAGWIFADYKNKLDGTDKNLVIYGHNMRDDSMFGSLKKVINEEWYNNEDNRYITLITESQTQIYEVFSVYQIEKEDYYIQTNFNNETEFSKFVDTLKKRSKKDFNVNVSSEDDILTLSTCANNNKYRVVLHAKKYIRYQKREDF